MQGASGAEDFPFSRVGYPLEVGLKARDSVAKLGDGVAFVSQDRLGEAQVSLMNGYTPVKISTHDIDREINATGSLSAITGFSYMIDGHQFYQINSASKSYLYDLSTGAWSIVKSYGIDRHRADDSLLFLNRVFFYDYRDARIYEMVKDYYYEEGEPHIMSITGKHVFNNGERMSVSELFIDMQTGVGATSGQGSDPQISLEVSKDSGSTWGNPVWKTFGAIGSYLTRASWFRIGRAYVFTFRVTISDPVKRVIVGAWIKAHD
jgi:hypothetical protein